MIGGWSGSSSSPFCYDYEYLLTNFFSAVLRVVVYVGVVVFFWFFAVNSVVIDSRIFRISRSSACLSILSFRSGCLLSHFVANRRSWNTGMPVRKPGKLFKSSSVIFIYTARPVLWTFLFDNLVLSKDNVVY